MKAQEEYDAKETTRYLLRNPKNGWDSEELDFCDSRGLLKSNFTPGDPVRIIIHGFRSSPSSAVSNYGEIGYRILGNFNVIVIDWYHGAKTLNYILAIERIFQIGSLIAEFIECLLETFKGKMQLSDVYLIGHSLGAHMAGIVGKNIKSGKIPVIFGIDPAGPLFSLDDPDGRLNENDAEYVEVIHTDVLQGFREPLGTADFYANYGAFQPGCLLYDLGCHHRRSIFLWAESLTSAKGFWADPCESYEDIQRRKCTKRKGKRRIKMGGEPGNRGKARGVYYFQTSDTMPFALGNVKFK
ncbi:lipase member H-like [Culicoides brevitarsis]|uniref:lipase member H-like n=1 Tax=Culicoides brevitarsis TaxID=469753 RepID=UPI00307C03E5